MNKNSHIKTHFDSRVILSFITILLISGIILAFRINESDPCLTEDFKVEASAFRVGELVTFSDYTGNAHTWTWDFGDGNQASHRSKVAHQYKKPGKYLVNLRVNKHCNVTRIVDIKPDTELIDSTLIPRFYAPKTVYVNEKIAFRDSTPHARSWQWRFGESDKIDAIDKNPSYSYSTPGEKTILLLVNDDIKYLARRKIIVLPAREENTGISRVSLLADTGRDPVDHFLEKEVPLIPPSEQQSVFVEKTEEPEEAIEGPELELTEERLPALIQGVITDELSYNYLIRYFCKDHLPRVQLKNGEIVTLIYMSNTLRGKKIDLKGATMVRNQKTNCVSLIRLDYKKKGLF